MMPRDGGSTEHANGSLSGNGQRATEHNGQPLRRGAFRAMVQDFSPLWFTWTMNAGALAELIHQCPYRFNGIDILANIFFVIALVTYILSSTIFTLRFLWFKHAAYHEIATDMTELTFASCWAIAFMTLTSCVALIVSTAWWGGYAFSIVAYVMWWFVQTWNAGLLLWAFTTLIRRHEARDQRIPVSIIIPAVSTSTIGVTGAVVSAYAYKLSSHLAVPVMVVSFKWTGVGIALGFILYVYIFHALLTQGWPAPPQTATVFILVGPMGQSAASLQILGAAASTYGRFADYNSGAFLTAESAKGVAASCTVVALLLNGLGAVWMFFGIFAMVERAVKKELSWTPAWNAIIFPNATLTTSFLAFSIDMDSSAYRVVTAIMIIVLVIVFLVNIYSTVLRIWQGKLLIVREDWRVKRAMEQDKDD